MLTGLGAFGGFGSFVVGLVDVVRKHLGNRRVRRHDPDLPRDWPGYL